VRETRVLSLTAPETPETLVLNPALGPLLFEDLLDQTLGRTGLPLLVLTVR
jgi:hypothetical protein